MITHESGNEILEAGKHSPKQAATNSSSHSPPTTFKAFSFLLSFAQFLCQPKNFHIKDHLTLIGRLWVQFSDNSKVSTHLIRLVFIADTIYYIIQGNGGKTNHSLVWTWSSVLIQRYGVNADVSRWDPERDDTLRLEDVKHDGVRWFQSVTVSRG